MPRYVGLNHVPHLEGRVIVSQLVATYMLSHRQDFAGLQVYSPDTGPAAVVRDADGKIVGTTQLLKYI